MAAAGALRRCGAAARAPRRRRRQRATAAWSGARQPRAVLVSARARSARRARSAPRRRRRRGRRRRLRCGRRSRAARRAQRRARRGPTPPQSRSAADPRRRAASRRGCGATAPARRRAERRSGERRGQATAKARVRGRRQRAAAAALRCEHAGSDTVRGFGSCASELSGCDVARSTHASLARFRIVQRPASCALVEDERGDGDEGGGCHRGWRGRAHRRCRRHVVARLRHWRHRRGLNCGKHDGRWGRQHARAGVHRPGHRHDGVRGRSSPARAGWRQPWSPEASASPRTRRAAPSDGCSRGGATVEVAGARDSRARQGTTRVVALMRTPERV